MIQAQASMRFYSLNYGTHPAEVNVSRFQGSSGVEEYHLMMRPALYGSISDQLQWMLGAYQRALGSLGLNYETCVIRRFFCSDLLNQASALEAHAFANPQEAEEPCAVSWVCQPPAPPAKVALWAYHINAPGTVLDKSREDMSMLLRRGDLTHVWTTSVTCTGKDTSYGQTEDIFGIYEESLQPMGMRLADNVIRTWFFVQNVDVNYQGLVDARREIFAKRGLTPDTHFIASTGIEGKSPDISAKVMMDAYAIRGVRGEQIQFLSAPSHLSPTHIYGVTFERGVSIAYSDRKHISISGTASIDSAGEIVYPGDVQRQLNHTLENIEALLQQAGAALHDACMFIVYVRDPSDVDIVQRMMRVRVGEAPVQVVVAPACRPGWLIEIECQAIVPDANSSLPAF